MQPVLSLSAGDLVLRVRLAGGAILGFDCAGVPLLRPATDEAAPGDVACFPLVPFGNRVPGNRFPVAGRDVPVTPNTSRDPLHLHGNGWLETWSVEEQSTRHLVLQSVGTGQNLPHHYIARQSFALSEAGLEVSLHLRNTDRIPMPFGLGWHPFFPLTEDTLLCTRTGRFWQEGPDYLPQSVAPLPPDLTFDRPRPLPGRWINNAFEGWSRRAEIFRPSKGLGLTLTASEGLGVMQIYRPAGVATFFALEPMSHVSGRMTPGVRGGLQLLQPGETLSGSIVLRPHQINDKSLSSLHNSQETPS